MKKVLVTGGTGLVGKAIEEENNVNYEFKFLSSKDCNLTKHEEVKKLFMDYRPDIVIHLAADVGGLYKNMSQKSKIFNNNTLINFNVLNCCYEFDVKKCISCLSTCVFPDNVSYPIDETMLHDGPPHDSNYTYAYTKRILEVQSRAYYEETNNKYISIIPTNIYGKYDNFSLEEGHVIPSLIHKCFIAKKENKPFVVRGSGKALRQFIHSSDLAKLIIFTMENYDDKEPIILSVDEDEEVSIKYVATKIAECMDYLDNLIFDESFSDGQIKKTASSKKLKKLIKDFKFKNIDEGLSETISWFISKYPNLRT